VLGSDFKALGVVRSLGRRGIACVVIDDLPRSAWYSRYVRKRFRWSGAMWGPAFVQFLVDLATNHGLRDWVLLPLQDEVVELVARSHASLSGPYRLVTQDWDRLRWAHDKRLVRQVAGELGIPYPRTWIPAGLDELAQMEITYPAIIKPAISIRLQYAIGRKVLPVHSRRELLEQYRFASSIIDPQVLMVQETIPGNGGNQFSVGAFCKDGQMVAALTARRTRQYPLDYGLASTFVEAIEIPELLEPARRLIARLGLSGLVEVEFKRDARDGADKLLDINLRPWGWHTLCIACGLDFPYMQYLDAMGERVEPVLPHYGPRWRRLVTDVPAAWQEIRERITTPARYLRSLPGPTVASVMDLADPLPGVADLAVTLRRAVHRGRSGRAPLADEPVSSPVHATVRSA
jgi:D-aspartate ligase